MTLKFMTQKNEIKENVSVIKEGEIPLNDQGKFQPPSSKMKTFDSKELQVGHIIRLIPGMKVPADCIFV